MIETSDPGTGYPTSYEDVRGIARDPEWQCRVAEMRKSAFNEMPVHCKKAALAGKGFNVPMALAESDPIRVAKMSSKLTDSPLPKFHLPDGGYSPSNLALAFSAKATDKSSTEEREGGCDWDKDGTDDCAATITDPGPDPIDGLASADASVSGVLDFAVRGSRNQLSCADALREAGKTQAGLARAHAALRQIYQTVGDVNIARLLGAIGIQESDFIPRNQLGGGPGRGVFQIEPKTYGITEAEANNLQTAANAIANNWSRVWGDILTGLDNGGFDVTSSNIQYWALAGLARVHNRGRGGVVVSGNSGSSSSGSLLDLAIQKGDISILDNAGTNRDRRYTQTANGTYVRNVMDLFFSCFGG